MAAGLQVQFLRLVLARKLEFMATRLKLEIGLARRPTFLADRLQLALFRFGLVRRLAFVTAVLQVQFSN